MNALGRLLFLCLLSALSFVSCKSPQSKINRIEKRFLQLEKVIKENYSISDATVPLENLLDAFTVIRIVDTFAYSYYPDYDKIAYKDTAMRQMPNPNLFFYSFADLPKQSVARFSPLSRVMELSNDFDEDNIHDMLGVLAHEIRHTLQDNDFRSRIRTVAGFKNYQTFLAYNVSTERPRISVAWEVSAYAYEIELLNIYTKGELKRRVLDKTARTIRFVKLLNATRDSDQKLIQNILSLAEDFYPEGLTGGRISDRFYTRIAESYFNAGFDCYVFDNHKMAYVPFRDLSVNKQVYPIEN